MINAYIQSVHFEVAGMYMLIYSNATRRECLEAFAFKVAGSQSKAVISWPRLASIFSLTDVSDANHCLYGSPPHPLGF